MCSLSTYVGLYRIHVLTQESGDTESSDNFPTTWSDDGYQYVIFGDGGGFDYPQPPGSPPGGLKASFGVARIAGDKHHAVYQDIYYGEDARSQGTGLVDACVRRDGKCSIAGKSWGIVSIERVLYSFINPGSDQDAYNSQRLYYSEDRGVAWEPVDWSSRSPIGWLISLSRSTVRSTAGQKVMATSICMHSV